jgi:hypothetical protein
VSTAVRTLTRHSSTVSELHESDELIDDDSHLFRGDTREVDISSR